MKALRGSIQQCEKPCAGASRYCKRMATELVRDKWYCQQHADIVRRQQGKKEKNR